MSFEDIIIEIKKNPVLWMTAHPNHKNRAIKAKLWRELSTKLGLQELTLKKRWKHLRDQYRKELKKKPITRSEDKANERQSGWKHFENMKFIMPEMLPASSGENLNPLVKEECSVDISYNEDSTDSEMEMGASASPTTSVSYPTSFSNKGGNVRDEMLDIEKKKMKLMEKLLNQPNEEEALRNDVDYMFLMSILPTMRKLSEIQKLRFRGKINDWLLEAIIAP